MSTQQPYWLATQLYFNVCWHVRSFKLDQLHFGHFCNFTPLISWGAWVYPQLENNQLGVVVSKGSCNFRYYTSQGLLQKKSTGKRTILILSPFPRLFVQSQSSFYNAHFTSVAEPHKHYICLLYADRYHVPEFIHVCKECYISILSVSIQLLQIFCIWIWI